MDELLSAPIPRETEATCDDCAMCGDEAPRGAMFDPRSKCCTYLPDIPNFLVGRILDGPTSKKGRATVVARLDAKIAVTPLGLRIPKPYGLLYRHAQKSEGFGRTPSLLCQHYLEAEAGTCGIWENRTSICSTWFCKHVRGAIGYEFWRSLEPLLSAIERALARWCILELDVGLAALRLLSARIPDDGSDDVRGAQMQHDDEMYRSFWGSWLGKEQTFFRECARLVNALAWNDVLRIGGVEVEAHARIVRELHRGLSSNELPERLKMGTIRLVAMAGDHTRIATYSDNDPLDVPTQLLPLLERFDGRRTRDVIADVAKRDGVELDEDLVQKLVDFEVLVSS